MVETMTIMRVGGYLIEMVLVGKARVMRAFFILNWAAIQGDRSSWFQEEPPFIGSIKGTITDPGGRTTARGHGPDLFCAKNYFLPISLFQAGIISRKEINNETTFYIRECESETWLYASHDHVNG
jgi:hypothetical protein